MKTAVHFDHILIVALIGAFTLLFGGGYLLYEQDRDISQFNHVSGKLLSVTKTYEELPFRNPGKYRYAIIENYPKPFELFVGRESGDFAPKIDKVDQLEQGDSVTVFYGAPLFLEKEDPRINYNALQIQSRGMIYFMKDAKFDFYLGCLFITIGAGVIVLILFLRYKSII